jgi:hypothetical protein
MRFVILGVITGFCFGLLAIAVLGILDGYANPDGYLPGLFPGLPRFIAGCLWALAYFGLLAAAAGALVGGLAGGVAAGIQWLATRGHRACSGGRWGGKHE